MRNLQAFSSRGDLRREDYARCRKWRVVAVGSRRDVSREESEKGAILYEQICGFSKVFSYHDLFSIIFVKVENCLYNNEENFIFISVKILREIERESESY